ncbi:MAG: TRAP transporter small permease [Alphaproteobacteria bacterium]
MRMLATAVDRIIEAMLAALMAAMTGIVFAGVIYRYVLISPLSWTEEIGKYCLIWASLLGTYIAVRRAENIRVDAIYNRVPPDVKRAMRILSHFVMAIFLAVLIYEGTRYSAAFLATYSPMMGLSLGWVYSVLPISAALMLVATIAQLGVELKIAPSPGSTESRG